MTIVCRVLGHQRGTGSENMALDEALLEYVALEGKSAYLRTYEWTEPTLSLGYFQRFIEAEADRSFQSIPIVRRPTGGGALLHDKEITYAIVIPEHHSLARETRRLYQAIHEAVACVVASVGLGVSRRGKTGQEETQTATWQGSTRQPRPFLCFMDRDEDDLVLRQNKLVGSAQRRRHGAVLQHGALLLSRSRYTPNLPGVFDLTDAKGSPSLSVLSRMIHEEITKAIDVAAIDSVIPESVLRRAAELETSNYSNVEWTRRR